MKKENKLINKINRLIKKAGLPRWLHRYGPKKYEFWHHALALLIKAMCRLSFRRVVKLLRSLGFTCPAKSTLHDTTKKLPVSLWRRLLKATCGIAYIAAIDGTAFSRRNPSYHYLKRIDGKMPKVPIKLSALVDTRKKKFLDAKVRILPAHDIKDAKSLVKQNNFSKLVADKAYDANWLHILCLNKGIEAHISWRNYGKVKHKNMSKRRLAQKHFRTRTYHRREIVEAMFHAIKTTMGGYTFNKKAKTIRVEMYIRLIAYNIFSLFIWLSGQSIKTKYLYILSDLDIVKRYYDKKHLFGIH